MVDPRIVTSPVRALSEHERQDLLTLHEACKAAKKSDGPYQFDWLIDLLRAPIPVYAVDIRMDTAAVTLYVPEDEPLSPPSAG
ncbi:MULTISPECIES: hypothetical protein [Ralstonia solanacearum species complex]|uniref:hypothetical protein n=1 Tax=Ralstonia solanacearum species complex TaxID=3116862 RepID=UPI0018D0557A|nr:MULTISPECIES: hypothetical protein [Ralstonia solanacearum species complex]MDN3368258.1 hypothetical protein [Ralstonia pseudosolanacearum]